MAKMTKAELKKRKAALSSLARQQLAKTEIMRFRLEPDNIINLYKLAEKKKVHVSTMVRNWVLECMKLELAAPSSPKRSTKHTNTTDSNLLNDIMVRLDRLETAIHSQKPHI
jgi:hypothetical protein